MRLPATKASILCQDIGAGGPAGEGGETFFLTFTSGGISVLYLDIV